MSQTLADIHARKEHRKRLFAEHLARITDQLASMGALRVIVFGSFAEDAVRSTSDLELIVVMPPEKRGRNGGGSLEKT